MTVQANQSAAPLNPVQLHLIHLFSKKMSEKELKELKTLLVEWYDGKAQEIMDKLWRERGLTQESMDKLLEMRLHPEGN